MSEQTMQQERVAGGNASFWGWVALAAVIAAGITMVAFPESPAFSIGLAVLGLGSAWLAKGVTNPRALVVLAAALGFLVLAIHLTVGLAWSSTTVGG